MPKKKLKNDSQAKEKSEKTKEKTIEKDELENTETNEEKEKYSDVKVILYNKEYTVADMNKLMQKENKSYNEQVLCNRYVEEMKNLYLGIERAADNTSSYKVRTIEELEKNLDYDYVERRCSRKFFKFNKKGVAAVLDFMKNMYTPLQK